MNVGLSHMVLFLTIEGVVIPTIILILILILKGYVKAFHLRCCLVLYKRYINPKDLMPDGDFTYARFNEIKTGGNQCVCV